MGLQSYRKFMFPFEGNPHQYFDVILTRYRIRFSSVDEDIFLLGEMKSRPNTFFFLILF